MIEVDFNGEITTALGGALVDIELTTADYTLAFERAKRIFIQRGNNNFDKKYISLDVTAGTEDYTLVTGDNIDTIIQIIKPKSGFSSANPFYVEYIQGMFGSMISGGMSSSLLTYELQMQTLENFDRYFINHIDYIWKKRDNTLKLLKSPEVDETWFLEIFADLSDDEYRDLIWIQNFAIAESKIILGMAYRKFSTITTPAGEVTLHGEQLIVDGKEEKLTLLENIADYLDGEPAGGIFILG